MTESYSYVLCLLVLSASGLGKRQGKAGRTPSTECALFTSTDFYVSKVMDPAYISLGTVDVGDYFSVSMDILVGPMSTNGQLFAASNKDPFDFYEWPPDVGKATVYIGMEITYEALAMIAKPKGAMYSHSIEVYNTWPEPYTVHDGGWHHVNVVRDDYISKVNVSIDDILAQEDMTSSVDMHIPNAPAYIGGRPGYYTYQFTGVIKNVQVNGYDVTLGDKPTSENGHVVIVPCSSETAQDFIAQLYDIEYPYTY